MQHRPIPTLAPQSKILASALTRAPSRILVVGNDARMRSALCTLVRRFGYDVHDDDGAHDADAVVVDTRNERALEELESFCTRDWSTPVIAIVSRDAIEITEEAERLGAVVLPMPIEPEDLKNGLASLLE